MGYRIFIAYRGETQGFEFAKALYDDIHTDTHYLEKYGKIYLSTEEEKYENFITSIERIMQDVELFILPLTAAFFDDFKDKGADSVTNKEIQIALKNPDIKFVTIEFPGYRGLYADKNLLRELYGNEAVRISCCKSDSYDPVHHIQILHKLEDDLVRKDYEVKKMKEFIHAPQKKANVRMEFKEDTEDSGAYPYEKLYDIKKIMLLNFAATTFLSGCDIADIYKSNEYFRRRFLSKLLNGDIEVEAVLTRPDSYAAIDAEKYKMYPAGSKEKQENIILRNINKFFSLKEANPDIRMNIRLTDIALPYGLMITEHENSENDHMKVDIYAPVISDDRYRPSFYLLKHDQDTIELYTRFRSTFEHIRDEYSKPYDLHAHVGWMRTGKPIIHRGMIDKKAFPHTKGAFLKCLSEGYPIEVDLLELLDGTIIVGREDEIEKNFGISHAAEWNYSKLIKKLDDFHIEESLRPMCFKNFLDLIHGKIPVLCEIKSAVYDQADERIRNIAQNVVKELRSYIRNYGEDGAGENIAVHSANPYILRAIREEDCMIPIGQISMDYEKGSYEVSPKFLEIHKNQKYFEIIVPDFVSYNIENLPDKQIRSACGKYDIPLIAWTIRSPADEESAKIYCDNYIVEKTYEP